MKLFRPVEYLFYRIYALQLRWFGKDELPEITALVSLSLLIGANIYTLLMAISRYTTFKIIDPLYPDKLKAGLGLLIIMGANAFFFIRNKRYIQIAERFKDESASKRRINLFMIFIYIILSFILLFTV